MKSKLNFLTACVLITYSFLTSCKKDETNYTLNSQSTANSILRDSVYKGPKVKVFGGKAWVWVKLNGNAVPKQLAITISNSVLTTIPSNNSGGENEIVIPAPLQANITSFLDFAIDWSPQGHWPDSIYGLPLFDFHFYKITEIVRQAIPNDPDYIQHSQDYPDHNYLPRNYDTVYEGGIPGGGCLYARHWYNHNAPEFQGQKFKHTFVYGTYNGKVNLYGPMMTLQFLKNVQGFQGHIPQPVKFAPNGYYPTQLNVLKHDGVIDIIFENFVLRPAA
jgi:hypothetical protein